MNKIKVMYYEVGEEPKLITMENELKEMQSLVEGYIQAVPIGDNMWLVCNEEGKLMGLPNNRYCEPINDMIAGNFFVCNNGEEDFSSLSDSQIDKLKAVFK